jgi:hypothetical protein
VNRYRRGQSLKLASLLGVAENSRWGMPGISSCAAVTALTLTGPLTFSALQSRNGALPVAALRRASSCSGSVVQAPIGVVLLVPW